MKNMSRALRRHHHERMVQRAMRIPYLYFDYYHYYDTRDELRARARFISNNMAQCSCAICGNPRRAHTFGKGKERITLSEHRAYDSFNDQLEEVDLYENLTDNTKDI